MRTFRHPEIVFLLGLLAAGSLDRTANGSQTSTAGQAAQAGNFPAVEAPFARDIDELRRIEADYVRAEMENSAAIAATILADDYIGMKADGGTTSKSEVLNNLAVHAHDQQPVSITATNMRVHVFGDMACVTYTKIYIRPNSQASFSENIMHIFTKRNGIWHLQVSTLTPSLHRSTPRPS